MKTILLLAISVALAGCTRPGDHPINPNCVWTEVDNRPLNLESGADRRHLRDDAVTAEDVAIRWADKHFGHLPEWVPRQDECMEKLFNGVASQHGVEVALVREYRLRRDVVVDSAAILGFGVIYAVAAYVIAGMIRRRFPPEEPFEFWTMTLIMAVGVSFVGLLLGYFWSISVETLRLNSVHLSYRMARIPWRQHWATLFVFGVIIFLLAAMIRPKVSVQRSSIPSFRG